MYMYAHMFLCGAFSNEYHFMKDSESWKVYKRVCV